MGDNGPGPKERNLRRKRVHNAGAKVLIGRGSVGAGKKAPLADEENYVVGFLGASSDAAAPASRSSSLSDEGVVDDEAVTAAVAVLKSGGAGVVSKGSGSGDGTAGGAGVTADDEEEVKHGAGESGDVAAAEAAVRSPAPVATSSSRGVPMSEPRPRRKKTAASAVAARVKANKSNRRKSWEASSCVNKIEEIQKRREKRR